MAASQLHYDPYQFNRCPQPVREAEYTAEGFQVSQSLSFDDWRSCHLESHKHAFRRLETPEWALNNRQLRDVVVRFAEIRANQPRWRPIGTMEERLQRAIKHELVSKPRMIEVLGGLTKRYVAEKNAGKDSASLKRLAVQIENLDTCIRFLGRGHLLALGIIHHYYRCGSDSVVTGAALGIKPPHVRRVLGALAWAAAHPQFSMPRVSIRINMLRGLRSNPLRVPAKGQRQCWVCGIFFTPTSRLTKHLCSTKCRQKRLMECEKARAAGKPQPPQYYCGPACKEAARFVTKPFPALLKPGVGNWLPNQAPAGYESYVEFCTVIGCTPLSETAWRMEAEVKKPSR